MKIVAISGSPRKHGNTVHMLERCLEKITSQGPADVKLISLAGKTIEPCIACGKCRKTKDMTCAIKGDAFNEILAEIIKADCVILGSPVYFGSATPQLMALLDRAGYVSRGNWNLLARKIGGAMVVARRAGQNFTLAQLLMWFMINDMVVPGSSYWNVAFGSNPGEVNLDEEASRTIDRFAENLCWLGEKLLP